MDDGVSQSTHPGNGEVEVLSMRLRFLKMSLYWLESVLDVAMHKNQRKMHHLMFFAFSLIFSLFTKIPFPLYGSGFLHSLISAAN